MKTKRSVSKRSGPKTGGPAHTERQWDPARHLDSPDLIVAYLNAAFEDGDPGLIAAAVGDVARACGMTAIAGRTGLGRESLYKALSRNGNPGFSTVLEVLAAAGFRLHVSRSRQ